ncbi:MAG: hypothetical protein H9893_07935 [Candidatus Niameybacter stercoravium]|nr:hypothetical protein [Candidatus Niameybacter stercoravium]
MNYQLFHDMIKKIDGILHVKIQFDEETIKEIHIVAGNNRSAKQIVRDIESTLLAVFDYEIDRKIISIAQIDTEIVKPIKRIKYEGLSIGNEGNELQCQVKLEHEGEIHSCIKQCIKTTRNRYNIIARTTIGVIEEITKGKYIFDVQDTFVTDSKEISFACVIVNMIEKGKEDHLIGTALIRDDINEAMARATLDAVNRKLTDY